MGGRLGYLALFLGLALPSWCADKTASIAGYIHASNGRPQTGAVVEVFGRAAETLKLITDDRGFFQADGLAPGAYTVKASAPQFLPTLREKIFLRAGASILVNLTLSTVFDVLEITPRRGNSDDGDWDWVLRSAANRPVLRILPNGSPVMVADKTSPNVKGAFSFVAGAPSEGFGSLSDMSTGFLVEKSIFASDTLTVNGSVGYGSALPNAVLRSSYKHQMANGSTPEVAFTMRRLSSPDLGIRNTQLEALALTTSDDITLGDILELKFGSELETIQFMGRVTAFRPFGKIAAHLSPDTVVEYRYSTSRPDSRADKGFETAPADLSESDPRLSMTRFSPALERAHHHELALSHREGKTRMQAAFYSDRLTQPALTGVGEFSSIATGDVLPDVYSGTFSYEGSTLATHGMRLVLERQLTPAVFATVDYGYGGVLDFRGETATLENVRNDSLTRNRHALAAKFSGTTPHSRTHWIASYGWTSGRALTPVDMFNASAGQTEPFLNLFLRQPVPCPGPLTGHMDVVIDVRNLLAQGYVPVFGQDGRTVYLVQSARAVRGGLAFSF